MMLGLGLAITRGGGGGLYPGADLVLDPYGRYGAQIFRKSGVSYQTLAAMITAGAATFSRASDAYLTLSNGTLQNFASGQARNAAQVGFLPEEGRTNLFLNSFAPATQNVTLSATGNYAVSVVGSGSVTVAAGTATITNGGAVTAGSPRTINCTGTGTISVTVTGSPTAVQVELGAFSTSIIATTGASASRAADNLSVPYSIPAGQDFTITGEEQYTRDTGSAVDLVNASNGTVNNMVQIVKTGGANIQGVVYVAGVGTLIGQAIKSGARVVDVEMTRVGDLYTFKIDGSVAGTATVSGLPSLTDMSVGRRVTNANWLNDTIQLVTVTPR